MYTFLNYYVCTKLVHLFNYLLKYILVIKRKSMLDGAM